MSTKTLTMRWPHEYKAFIPGGTARLLALAVTYSPACPANTGVAVGYTWPPSVSPPWVWPEKVLLWRGDTNVDLPLSQVTEPEVDPSGAAREAPATVHPLVRGALYVDVFEADILTDTVTVTAVVEV